MHVFTHTQTHTHIHTCTHNIQKYKHKQTHRYFTSRIVPVCQRDYLWNKYIILSAFDLCRLCVNILTRAFNILTCLRKGSLNYQIIFIKIVYSILKLNYIKLTLLILCTEGVESSILVLIIIIIIIIIIFIIRMLSKG